MIAATLIPSQECSSTDWLPVKSNSARLEPAVFGSWLTLKGFPPIALLKNTSLLLFCLYIQSFLLFCKLTLNLLPRQLSSPSQKLLFSSLSLFSVSPSLFSQGDDPSSSSTSLIQKRRAVTSDMHTQSNLSISGSITELASWARESRNRIGARTIKSYFSSFSLSHYCFPSGPPPPSSDLHSSLLSLCCLTARLLQNKFLSNHLFCLFFLDLNITYVSSYLWFVSWIITDTWSQQLAASPRWQ